MSKYNTWKLHNVESHFLYKAARQYIPMPEKNIPLVPIDLAYIFKRILIYITQTVLKRTAKLCHMFVEKVLQLADDLASKQLLII